MAKHNECDILSGAWNPVVGCQRLSVGCRDCWWLDAIMPWQQDQGNLPRSLKEGSVAVIEDRFNPSKLLTKTGIVGIVQHGDLFWDKIDDATITRVLDVVDQVGKQRRARRQNDTTKYVLWTKRAKRMADILEQRYEFGLPPYLACGVSVENQALADDRLPHLMRVNGYRFVMIEPMIGPIDLTGYEGVHWIVLGSETGEGRPRPMDINWARQVRDFAVGNDIPFFIKQVGTSHIQPVRELDGRTWDQFPVGFIK